MKTPEIKAAKEAYHFAKENGKLDAQGENVISQDAYYSYNYAFDVIKGRWIEAEEIIKTRPNFAYHYALNVIKGRWELGENTISQSAKFSYYYAHIIKNKLPESWHNKMIMLAMNNDYWAKKYLEFIK